MATSATTTTPTFTDIPVAADDDGEDSKNIEYEYDADTGEPIDAIVFVEDPEDLSEQRVNPSLRLLMDKKSLSLSLNSIRFAVFADAVTATILDPNFAFMASPNAYPDSFKSTDPFGYSAATYFLGMTALLGMAIASTVIGALSDRTGRKPWILLCLGVGAVGAIANYLARESFWGFCAANFSQGLFAASLPVAMAYVSDVKRTRKEKDAEIGILVALNMMGTAGGGICAILMEEQGLFAPLFIGAAINTVATIVGIFYIIEPNRMLLVGTTTAGSPPEEDEDEVTSPKTLDKRLLVNIITGALFDNIGSAGLFPIIMAPLAITEFHFNFLEQGLAPIMSQTAFKWISVMVALTVIPGAGLSTVLFEKIGPAASCVIGNVITGLVILACMMIALIEPATNGTFAGFICALYVGFPFTVLSQLSTGPLLDTIAPSNRRGFVQGLNIAVMAFASAVSPYMLGEMSDRVGVQETLWLTIGISFLAALINAPLIFARALRVKRKKPKFARPLLGEDVDIVERALQGKWVPAKDLDTINDERMKKGDPFLIIPYKEYREEKDHLHMMRSQARTDFLHLRHVMYETLSELDDGSTEKRQTIIDQLYASRASTPQREDLAKGLGKWFADYIVHNGYWIEDSPIMYKQMIMKAFPPINENGSDNLTVENVQQAAVNYTSVLNKYLDEFEVEGATRAFAGSVVVDYQA